VIGKSDHKEKASCGPEMKELEKRTKEKKQVVVRKRRNWKNGPQRKSKLWSGNEVIGKTDHREKASCGPKMKELEKRTTTL